MKRIAVVLKPPLAEIFGLSGASYYESYSSIEEFKKIIQKISDMDNVGMVIVPSELEDECSQINKIVVGV